MAFPVERNTQRLQEREIPGTQLNAAVDCWFTAEGKTMPRFCKIEGTEGELGRAEILFWNVLSGGVCLEDCNITYMRT
ncbi:MAG: hypothetical protein ACRC3H_12920 [Lachnospiraceae bacterium]